MKRLWWLLLLLSGVASAQVTVVNGVTATTDVLPSTAGQVAVYSSTGNVVGGQSTGTTFAQGVNNFAGLQFAISEASLGSPTGTMTGYTAGDTIILQCPGISFSLSPVIGVTAQSGGVVTSAALAVPGFTTGNVASGSVTCTQSSTSGSGTGFQIPVQLGLIASTIQPSSLLTGGGSLNGNLIINYSTNESPGWTGAALSEDVLLGTRCGFGLTGLSQFDLCECP